MIVNSANVQLQVAAPVCYGPGRYKKGWRVVAKGNIQAKTRFAWCRDSDGGASLMVSYPNAAPAELKVAQFSVPEIHGKDIVILSLVWVGRVAVLGSNWDPISTVESEKGYKTELGARRWCERTAYELARKEKESWQD